MAQKNSIEANREGAAIYTGDDLCRQKSIELLEELNLPRGLLPMDGNVEELGDCDENAMLVSSSTPGTTLLVIFPG